MLMIEFGMMSVLTYGCIFMKIVVGAEAEIKTNRVILHPSAKQLFLVFRVSNMLWGSKLPKWCQLPQIIL